MWYSCLQHRDSGAAGGGQSLVSPGSCLEEFRTRPFIECRGLGTCNYFATAVSYWLATIKDYEQFRKPLQQTLKADHTSRVSRCAVCQRRRVSEEYEERLKPLRENRYPQSIHPGRENEEQRTIIRTPPARSRNPNQDWQRYQRPAQQRSPYRRPQQYPKIGRDRIAGLQNYPWYRYI